MKRKKSFQFSLFFLCFLLVFAILFWYVQNFTFSVNQTKIYTEKVTSPITVVQLTDLHGAVYGTDNRRLVSSVKKQTPDIICVTGDMFTNGDAQGKNTVHTLMKQLVEIAPVYFVPGEHDNDTEFMDEMASYGVTLLLYAKNSIEINGNLLSIYGINNVYYSDTFNLFREFDKPSDETFNILLAHIPNFDAFNWFGPDLSLCGDTHGGVVQLPFLGPLYFEGDFLPQITSNKQYVTDKGLFETYTGHVYVSGGLGNYPYAVRMFNQPELSVITILPKE